MLTRKRFQDLANFNNQPCISIYIPTERAGKEVLNGKASIHLKSEWKKVKTELKERNTDAETIKEFDKKLDSLISDKNFWRHQLDGLAVFVASGFFEYYSVPKNFETFCYVADYFYLKPLLSGISENNSFFILSVNLDKVRLYRAHQDFIQPLNIDNQVPQQLEDRVGYDFEEKNLQSSTSNFGDQSGLHGFGAAERDRKNEILRFFRAVDKGISEKIKDEALPLVVSCDDANFSIYKEASSYEHLYPEKIPGNPSDYRSVDDLHKKALEVMHSFFETEKQKKLNQFRELNKTQKSSTSIDEIIPAIYQGKVDTLFVRSHDEVWGDYNENMASVQIDRESKPGNKSLVNLAAIKVIEQGGTVYVMENDFLPDNNAQMNALFRY
ncbi:MAG TPA: hypothetical protein VFM70_12140 [Salinimicrobium sp.]|nr:hypothetical protein [Salinimicrobium sp.]